MAPLPVSRPANLAFLWCIRRRLYRRRPHYVPIATTTPETCLAQSDSGCGAAADPTTLAIGGCYASLDGKAFLTPNALGQYGNMGRNIFRDSGFKNLDMSIFKNFTFKERFGVQARREVFNMSQSPRRREPVWRRQLRQFRQLLNAARSAALLASRRTSLPAIRSSARAASVSCRSG